MTIFIGDYTCKIDAKGRVMLSAAFKKQMPKAAQDKFVIKKDIYEKCLVLFPMDEWERQNQLIRQNINPYNKEHAQFLREYYKDTADVELDANNRFLTGSGLHLWHSKPFEVRRRRIDITRTDQIRHEIV